MSRQKGTTMTDEPERPSTTTTDRRADDRCDADVDPAPDGATAAEPPTPPARVTPRLADPTPPPRRAGRRLGASRARRRPRRPPPRRRVRWAVALAVVALVVGTSAAVAALITGRVADATVLGYVPARHDRRTARSGSTCPATSARPSAQFLSKFPGFADQAALETQARRGPRPARQGRDRTAADLHDRHQAVVRRRARR